eukprot:ctg_2363.g530
MSAGASALGGSNPSGVSPIELLHATHSTASFSTHPPSTRPCHPDSYWAHGHSVASTTTAQRRLEDIPPEPPRVIATTLRTPGTQLTLGRGDGWARVLGRHCGSVGARVGRMHDNKVSGGNGVGETPGWGRALLDTCNMGRRDGSAVDGWPGDGVYGGVGPVASTGRRRGALARSGWNAAAAVAGDASGSVARVARTGRSPRSGKALCVHPGHRSGE